MKLKQILPSTFLIGTLALGGAGCVDYRGCSQYNYEGKIGEEQVIFKSRLDLVRTIFTDCNTYNNTLTIIKPDGRVVKYVDYLGNDLRLEYIEISGKGWPIKYCINNEVGKSVLEEAQKKLDSYLSNIKEAKINQGLENLK